MPLSQYRHYKLYAAFLYTTSPLVWMGPNQATRQWISKVYAPVEPTVFSCWPGLSWVWRSPADASRSPGWVRPPGCWGSWQGYSPLRLLPVCVSGYPCPSSLCCSPHSGLCSTGGRKKKLSLIIFFFVCLQGCQRSKHMLVDKQPVDQLLYILSEGHGIQELQPDQRVLMHQIGFKSRMP